MSDNIKPIGGGPDDLTRRGQDVVTSVRRAIQRLTFELQRRVKEEKLSGQVLNVRSGRLRRSINAETKEADGQLVGSVGTNVEYAAKHEFGLSVDEQVKEHVRKAKQVFGRMLKSPVEVRVRAHTRHVNYPERSFLRSALADMQGEMLPEIQTAVVNGLSNGPQS